MNLQLLALSISAISLTSIIAAPILAIASALNFNHPRTELPTATKPTLLSQRSGEGTTRDVNTNTNQIPLLRQIRVYVHSARTAFDFDSRRVINPTRGAFPEPDFSVRLKINGQSLSRTPTFYDQYEPRFNTTFESNVSSLVSSVPIEISLIDEDDFTRADVADISPTSDSVLKLHYIPATGKIIGPTGTGLGQAGQMISIKGTSTRGSVINFRISHSVP